MSKYGSLLPFLMMPLLMGHKQSPEYDKFDDKDFLEKEYNLIKKKKSMLSARERGIVVYKYENQKQEDDNG